MHSSNISHWKVPDTVLEQPINSSVYLLLQLARARSMEQQAAASLQQAPSSSSSRRTSSLTNTLRGLTMRASGSGAAAGQGAGVGLGGELEGGSAAATPMPEKATKSVSAHDGGCFTCAFDR